MEITTILYEMNLFLFNENKLLLYLGKRKSIKHVKNNYVDDKEIYENI